MRSGKTTRGQLSAHYDCLKGRVETVTLRQNLLKDLVGVAKAVLDMYPIDGSAFASATTPDPNEFEEIMKSLLPSPFDRSSRWLRCSKSQISMAALLLKILFTITCS